MTKQSETKRIWQVIEFEVDAHQEDMAGWLMIKLGANGCEIDPAREGVMRLRATFEPEVIPGGDLSGIISALDEYGLNASIASLRTNELQEQDWLSKWKEGFEPFPVGERLLVCPPWHESKLTDEQRRGRKVVLIEPGLAFGTGFHETTRFCMLALQDYVDNSRRVLDIGTGSGILSIATALLTDKPEIIALETDPVACKNARENFELNGVSKRIQLFEGSTQLLITQSAHSFDLLLINLTYEDHIALLNDYVKLAAPGGTMIFAGILKEKGDLMSAALAEHGLTVTRRDEGKSWVGFTAKK
ncbi:MAG TPA: 50S ribosomal protein L11 methyltransferase [Candidatus Obscuribacterales bacterium]